MDKSCDNCYWASSNRGNCYYFEDKPESNICDRFDYKCCECDGENATHEYKNNLYCTDCLLKELDVESWTVTHYMVDGEYLGSDDDIDGVIENLSKDINEIE